MIPFTISLKKKIRSTNSTKDEASNFLKLFGNKLQEQKVNDFKIEENSLNFSVNLFSQSRWGIFSTINRGSLTTDFKGDYYVIIYKFSLVRLLILGLLGGLVFEAISGSIIIGIKAFLVLGVLNWIVAVIRNAIMFNKLTKQFNQ